MASSCREGMEATTRQAVLEQPSAGGPAGSLPSQDAGPPASLAGGGEVGQCTSVPPECARDGGSCPDELGLLCPLEPEPIASDGSCRPPGEDDFCNLLPDGRLAETRTQWWSPPGRCLTAKGLEACRKDPAGWGQICCPPRQVGTGRCDRGQQKCVDPRGLGGVNPGRIFSSDLLSTVQNEHLASSVLTDEVLKIIASIMFVACAIGANPAGCQEYAAIGCKGAFSAHPPTLKACIEFTEATCLVCLNGSLVPRLAF